VSNVLDFPVRVKITAHLIEGTSCRATARLCGVDKDTPMYLGVLVGRGCALVHDKLVRGVRMALGEVDEVWAYVGKHERRKLPTDPASWGDAYTMYCIDAVSKVVPSYLTAPRDIDHAAIFFRDLRSRVIGKPQVSVDGWASWPEAARLAFGWNGIDLGVVMKEYQTPDYDPRSPDRKYSPSRVKSMEKFRALGTPDMGKVSTSIAERLNLTGRMHQRRLTRLTNAYSKKRENLEAAVHLHFAWYNFVRPHESLDGRTPAMAAGIVDAPWSLAELVAAALAAVEAEPEAPAPAPAPRAPTEPTPPAQPPTVEPFRPMVQVKLPGIGAAPANDVQADEDDGEGPATVRDPLPWGEGAAL